MVEKRPLDIALGSLSSTVLFVFILIICFETTYFRFVQALYTKKLIECIMIYNYHLFISLGQRARSVNVKCNIHNCRG